MDKTESGMGWAGLLLFFVVIWILFGSMGGVYGANRGCGDVAVGGCGCRGISNCEVEKQEIIDSARTQFLVIEQNNATRDLLQAQRAADQAEKLFDAKAKIGQLENYISLSNQLAPIKDVLADLQCNCLKRPPLFGLAATCNGDFIPPFPTTTA